EVPGLLDALHSHFSYHTEHHLFPGMDSSRYPEVARLLRQQFSRTLQSAHDGGGVEALVEIRGIYGVKDVGMREGCKYIARWLGIGVFRPEGLTFYDSYIIDVGAH
ncbi:MAG TPA: fatty acid desaturase, partial [Opitutaceae bacterium]|nr:fatty acid desaturase [Opitutaceae bacterium]